MAHGAVRQVPDHRQRHFIAPPQMRIDSFECTLAICRVGSNLRYKCTELLGACVCFFGTQHRFDSWCPFSPTPPPRLLFLALLCSQTMPRHFGPRRHRASPILSLPLVALQHILLKPGLEGSSTDLALTSTDVKCLHHSFDASPKPDKCELFQRPRPTEAQEAA